MADKFRLDPAGTRDEMAKLDGSIKDFSDALGPLSATLQRYDGCWGGDKAGKKFAEGYVENAKHLGESLSGVAHGTHDLADGIRATVDEFQGLDEDNSKVFDHQLAEAIKQEEEKNK
ncbi:WXG100 family type VII secretion target [Amycolatopsis sp. lyj-23]|uniref:WXG100 family type VII secretion target n=1 Tax=Amycolatopsis sp. lyj-23 TaxID=2789283 RepID=UPI00397B22C9